MSDKTGPISDEEAREILSRFNSSHWKNATEHARYSIPADPRRDDDIRLDAYIAQTKELRAESTRLRAERDEARRYLKEAGDEMRARWNAINESLAANRALEDDLTRLRTALERIRDTSTINIAAPHLLFQRIARTALHPPREAPGGYVHTPAICTHPSFDDDGKCHTCGDQVASAVPKDFAAFNARMFAPTPDTTPGTACTTCGGTQSAWNLDTRGAP